MLDFPQALYDVINNRAIMYRKSNPDILIFAQIPANIPDTVIPKMTSLSEFSKKILLDLNVNSINYKNQLLQVNIKTHDATNYIPSTDDMFAKDFMLK